jgi:hypothetical protein
VFSSLTKTVLKRQFSYLQTTQINVLREQDDDENYDGNGNAEAETVEGEGTGSNM